MNSLWWMAEAVQTSARASLPLLLVGAGTSLLGLVLMARLPVERRAPTLRSFAVGWLFPIGLVLAAFTLAAAGGGEQQFASNVGLAASVGIPFAQLVWGVRRIARGDGARLALTTAVIGREWIRDQAAAAGQSDVAARIGYLFGESSCPACSAPLQIADAIAWDAQGSCGS